MKKTLLWGAIATLFFASCSKNEFGVESTIEPSGDFVASLSSETRTELQGTSVVWNAEDELTIFTKTEHNRQYRVKELSADGRTATFGYVNYTGTSSNEINANYAVYPYNADATISGDVISTAVAAEQVYNAEKVDLSCALMVAKSQDNSFAFVNAGSLMRFNISKSEILPDSYTLTSIKLTSAANNIAGNVTIDLDTDSKAVVSSNGSKEVTLTAIDTEITTEAQSFYIALPATNFAAKDLSVSFTFADGVKTFALPAFDLLQGSIKTIAYEITDFEDFTGTTPGDDEDFEGETPETEPKPASNEIWYTATAKVEPYDKNVFGATYKSSEWDSATSKGVITFTGDITKVGDKAFYNKSILTSITLPECVTEIGVDAFFQCTTLTSVVLPQGLKSINGWAFQTCLKLTDITIPQSVTSIGYCAFSKCASLTNITIPENVTTIAGSIFSGCTKLKNITFSDMVTSIESSAFSGCSSLESITIPQSVTSVASDAFTGCTALPITDNIRYADSFLVEATNTNLSSYNIKEGTRFIGDNAFTNCQYLTGITMPEGVLSIGMNAFKGCSSLTSINIPEGVLSIGKNAFQNCSSLTSINIPESVTSIPIYFVYGCSALTSLTIPASVTSIDDYAFMGCSSLQTLYVESETAPKLKVDKDGDNSSLTTCLILVPENSVEQYKTASVWKNNKNYIYPYGNKTVVYTANSNPGYNTTNDFGGATISSNYWLDSNKVGIIIFDKDITTFGTLFKEKNITGVTLPKSVTSIGESAFYGCQALTSIDIPEGVETINKYAFSYCNTLGSIKLPSTLKSIGEQTFYTNCNSVWVYCKATTPPTLGTKAFNVNKSLSLFVPRTLLNVYESSEWVTTYSARINPYTF